MKGWKKIKQERVTLTSSLEPKKEKSKKSCCVYRIVSPAALPCDKHRKRGSSTINHMRTHRQS